MKIYTRTGDRGETSLIGGSRVQKSDVRLHAYGTVDELNSTVGFLLVELVVLNAKTKIAKNDLLGWQIQVLQESQSRLFDLGSQLANIDPNMSTQLPKPSTEDLTQFESQIDEMEKLLTPLKHFVLPGGSEAGSRAHLARTICRRAERWAVEIPGVDLLCLQYLNRFSDYLFVLSRYVNQLSGGTEVLWQPNSRQK